MILTMHDLDDLLSGHVVQCLQQDQTFNVIQCADFNQVDGILSDSAVELLLLRVEGMDSLQVIGELIRAHTALKVLLTGDLNAGLLYEAVRIGVKGHLHRDISPELVTRAFRVVSGGELWFDRQTCAEIIYQFSRQAEPERKCNKLLLLSRREQEILEHLARGLRNRSIAQTLFISESTVKKHLYRIYEKLGVKDRLAAVLVLKGQLNSY